jgi:hypothetical protein
MVISMALNNDRNVQSDYDGTTKCSNQLNHTTVPENNIHSKLSQSERKSDVAKWRKHAFNVILPRKLSKHSDSDLRLMLVSLKNARCASIVHIHRIERELKKRGSSLTILG